MTGYLEIGLLFSLATLLSGAVFAQGIPAATVSIASRDPSRSVETNIGEKDLLFTGIRITTGSSEPMVLKSITWAQTGTGSSKDVSNVRAEVLGVMYDAKPVGSGKAYRIDFGMGVVIDPATSIDLCIFGDITGGIGKTIQFSILQPASIVLFGSLSRNRAQVFLTSSGPQGPAIFTLGSQMTFMGSLFTIAPTF